MLFVCGNNYAHQFGQDSNKKPSKGKEYISPPQQSVLGATSISSYSIYYWHSVIVTKSGEVMAAGKNRNGSIYKNLQYQELQKFTKFEIRDEEGKLYHPISAVCGEDYTLYLVSPSKTSDKKQLVYSNRRLFFSIITDFNPVAIFGGCNKSAAIDEEGSIVFIKESDIKTVEQFDKFHLPEGQKAVSVSFCNKFFIVLSNDGEVFMSKTDDINFKRENSLEKTKIIEISGIDDHCLAVSEDGKVFGYGSNDYGQLGIGKDVDKVNTFTEILALKDYTIVSAYAGADHSIFQTKSGKLLACGRNQYGQLLTSESSENYVYSPIETEIKEGATFCVAGWWKSSVFKNYIPLNSPNRKITIKGTTQNTEKATKSTKEKSILKKENSQLKKNLKEIETAFSIKPLSANKQSKSDENFFIDENEEKQFHINRGKIGEGATSVTYKIIDKRTKIPMCKKILKYKKGQATIKDAQRAMNEFRVLYEIAHPCICKAICINLSEPIDEENRNIVNDDDDDDDEEEEKEITTIAIFLEYVKYGLKDVLKKKIDDTLKTRIVLDIVHAMKFIHKCGMMHRDLKVENIMLNSFFDTKIVDFGLVKISESILDGFSFVEDSLTKGIGTLAYMSPEMANEEKYDNKTDVYSFGVVLYFIFYGDLPKQSLKDKMAGKEIQMPSPTKSISKFCIKLIKRCLSYSPSKRPSFEEILTQLRENKYELAADVDPSILEKRDKELEFIENYK